MEKCWKTTSDTKPNSNLKCPPYDKDGLGESAHGYCQACFQFERSLNVKFPSDISQCNVCGMVMIYSNTNDRR
jgi:hypothetical protein